MLRPLFHWVLLLWVWWAFNTLGGDWLVLHRVVRGLGAEDTLVRVALFAQGRAGGPGGLASAVRA